MRHQHTDHKCEMISDCSYSGKTLVEKRLFPEVMEIDKEFDPFHVTFTVTPKEKKKYDDEFNSLEPEAGLLSEEKVRDHFKTSYLPVLVIILNTSQLPPELSREVIERIGVSDEEGPGLSAQSPPDTATSATSEN